VECQDGSCALHPSCFQLYSYTVPGIACIRVRVIVYCVKKFKKVRATRRAKIFGAWF